MCRSTLEFDRTDLNLPAGGIPPNNAIWEKVLEFDI